MPCREIKAVDIGTKCFVEESTDHHSGFYEIEVGQTVTIEDKKQMTNWNGLDQFGTLIINGDLILK